MKTLAAGFLILLAAALPAAALELQGALAQGGLAIGSVAPGTRVLFDGEPVQVDSQSGFFVIGFGRDHGTRGELVLVGLDGAKESQILEIRPREWDIERIDGLPPRKVTPKPEDLERIRREGALIHAARARQGPETDFLEGFTWPVVGRISGRYGNQRILNGKPRRPHLGIDIAAPTGTPVAAAAAGTITLAERDLFYTGGTIVIDHGHGLTTIYSHLADVYAEPGMRVAQGAVIGTVGSTGRSTGPHLDWRLNWFQERLDPSLVAGPMK